MGQYYNIVLKHKDEAKVHAFDRHIDGEYTMAKLMEHSYYLNPMVNAICEKLYHRPTQIAWVGDYANETEEEMKLWKLAYGAKGNKTKYEMLHKTEFTLNGRFLVNHSKKVFIDCWKYLVNCILNCKNKEYASWVIHPLPLLTCVGNGRGGGDYRAKDAEGLEYVGSWCWDTLEIVEWEDMKPLTEKGYTEFDVIFEEC